jgi:hypothetical protein
LAEGLFLIGLRQSLSRAALLGGTYLKQCF